jgi:Ca2+-binding EF-hand superfamily protein
VYWSNGRWTWNAVPARTSSFDALDVNRDGFLSRAEAGAAMDTATFNRLDTNRDSFLSRTEVEPFMRWGVGASTDPYYGGTVYGPRY